MIGEIINEKYKIESVFSESHMYEVFTAIEAATGHTVVLKLMKEEMAINEKRVKIFSEEIKNFASLSHPNIAEILDLDVFDERPYVVSPLVEGKELNLIMKEEVLSLPDSVKIIQDLAAVLQYASDHKVENRNINLSNVIRKKDGHITVLSFSLPRLKLVTAASVKRNENSGIQADLYFLGTALYELLAGKSPIRKIGGLHELWDMNLEKDLRIRHPEIEPAHQKKIVEFIRKTLTREMNLRFTNYEDFLKGLADLAGNIRQANIKNRISSRQMSMASHVVDVLNNKINNTTTIVAKAAEQPVKTTKSNTVSASLKNAKSDNPSTSKNEMGFAETAVDGNLALAVENDEVSEDSLNVSMGQSPKLKLIKNTKVAKTKNKKSSEWAEDRNWLKSPVVLIGMALFVMVLLILFW